MRPLLRSASSMARWCSRNLFLSHCVVCFVSLTVLSVLSLVIRLPFLPHLNLDGESLVSRRAGLDLARLLVLDQRPVAVGHDPLERPVVGLGLDALAPFGLGRVRLDRLHRPGQGLLRRKLEDVSRLVPVSLVEL